MIRKKREQLVVTFSTTTAAMAWEKHARENAFPGRLIPLPTQISAGCGLAWKTETAEKDRIIRQMQEHSLKWEQMYTLLLF